MKVGQAGTSRSSTLCTQHEKFLVKRDAAADCGGRGRSAWRAREAGEHEGVGPGGDGLGDARLQQVHAQRPAHDRREQHEGRVLGRAHAALEEAELVDEQQREDELRGLEQHEVRRREAPRQRLLAQPVCPQPAVVSSRAAGSGGSSESAGRTSRAGRRGRSCATARGRRARRCRAPCSAARAPSPPWRALDAELQRREAPPRSGDAGKASRIAAPPALGEPFSSCT